MKIPDHFSASSLQLHTKNPRRWCLKYLEKLIEPSTYALEFGKELHTYIESKFTGNKYPNHYLNKDSLSIISDWHEYFTDLYAERTWKTEEKFELVIVPELPPLVGYIDLYSADNGTCIIYDHKSASKGYAEKEENLINNWQLCIYAQAVAGTNDCIIGHNQFFKERNQIKKWKIVNSNLTLNHRFDIIKNIEQEMKKCMKTIENYRVGGICAIDSKPPLYWYGRKDPYYGILTGKETIEQFLTKNPSYCRRPNDGHYGSETT